MARYTKLYKQIARETGAVFVPGILDGIFHQNKYKADQIHPNTAGYEIVAERVHKGIKPYLWLNKRIIGPLEKGLPLSWTARQVCRETIFFYLR